MLLLIQKYIKNSVRIEAPNSVNASKRKHKNQINRYNKQRRVLMEAILRSEPVLLASNFNKEFKLAVDASDVGAGGELLPEDDNGVEHPVCYFPKSLTNIKRIILQ